MQLLFFKNFIRLQLLSNVVLVSAIQQSESAICRHISPPFLIFFPFGSPRSVELSSLCYTVGSHQSPFTHNSVYTSIPLSQFISPLLSPLAVHMFVLHICVSISVLQIGSSVPFFYLPHILSKSEREKQISYNNAALLRWQPIPSPSELQLAYLLYNQEGSVTGSTNMHCHIGLA